MNQLYHHDRSNYRPLRVRLCCSNSIVSRPEAGTSAAGGVSHRSKISVNESPEGDTCSGYVSASGLKPRSDSTTGGSRHRQFLCRPPACRTLGVTLIEVVFSIGVILIGLVGLMSILPLAGHRAQDSIDFSVGAAFADSVADEALARGWIALHIDKDKTARRPFCIDPIFIASPPIPAPPISPPGPLVPKANAFSLFYFPYFKPNHDPLINPALYDISDYQSSMNTLGFVGQPRMPRKSLPNAAQLEVARTLVERVDDLNSARPKDRSKDSFVVGLEATSGGVKFGRTIPTGEYSWIITVDPSIDGNFASMSVVVLRDRDRIDQFPGNTTLADSTVPEKNANTERLAFVAGHVGFQGGAGGTVTLLSSANTKSRILPNDWIMLSSWGSGDDVHRWYRVLSADQEPEVFTPATNSVVAGFAVPDSSEKHLDGSPPPLGDNTDVPIVERNQTRVWRQTVQLAGPDWAFDNRTYATIMDDVVSVTERTISLADF